MSTSFVACADGRIAYEVHGQGPLVVLSHGMGENRRSYRHLIPLLVAAGYRVASVDVRGHGDSTTGWPSYTPAEVGGDLLAVVRDLGGGPAVLVGNSSSGAAVVFAATEAPESVNGIVLVGAFVNQPKLNPFMRLAMVVVLHSPRLFGLFHRTLFPVHRPADDAQYRRQLVAALRRPGRMAPLRGVIHPVEPHWTSLAAQVRQPVLVLMGTRDPDFSDPGAEARAARRLFPVAEARMITEAGHYPHADRPEAMAHELVAFLAEVNRA
ncbi:alpha/beta fold hydrolase [Micromonospora sp. DT48]|uniref:alpha/beta fold hydrolase n=1 Tax=Micromonospora sp. DT48 TaxID=3393429 RepID=UPI003CE6776C